MTTSKKLLIGFGTLLAVVVLIVLALSLWLHTLQAHVDRVTAVIEPTSAAAYEMEIEVLALGMATLRYLHTGEPEARQRVIHTNAGFEKYKAEYDRVAVTPRYKALGERIAVLFADYKVRADRLMGEKDKGTPPSPENLKSFVDLRNQLDDILDNEIQALAHGELKTANQDTHETLRTVLTAALILLFAGLLISAVTALVVSRGIVRTEQTLRVTLASIGDAVLTTDTEGRITYLNPVARSLTGWTHEEAAGKPVETVFRIINEDTREPVGSPVVEVVRHGKVVGLANHTVLIAKDGSECAIDDSAAPIFDERGSLAGVVLIFRDVSERRRAQRTIAESEARMRAMFQAALDCIISIDHEGKVIEFNPASGQTFGYRREDVLGRDLADLIIPPSLRERHRQGFARYLETGESVILDRRLLLTAMRADGAEFPVELAVTRIPTAGKPIFTAYLRDITEPKRMQDALRQYAADVLEADRRKSEFLAMLAHELRNPLAPITNALQILRLTGGNGEKAQPALDMMQRQLGQMVRLIDDLLDVSRISQGKIELRREPIELALAVNHAVEASRLSCEAMDQELSVTLPPEPLYLSADPARLAQVVGNLLNNACKFTGRGGRIGLTVAAEGAEAVIRVRDNGIGIAADQLPRIFEMFTQVDSSLDRAQSGLGIGLTLVRNLTEMHGGTVGVHSAGIGQGSEFMVRLPMLSGQRPAPGPQPSGGETAAAVQHRVLVVDDNPDSVNSLATLLKLRGHEVHAAHDGLEAVEAAASLRPDVILLDIGLPKLNGYEAARRIREQQGGESVVLVAVTGWGQEADRRRSTEAGFDHHLVKPVELEALQRVLASVQPRT